MQLITAYEQYYPELHPSPLFSGTLQSCVQRGCDAYSGGAVYNNTSVCGLGLASAADAVIAVKKLVFEEKRLTLPQLLVLLKNNWQGQEQLRLYARGRLPKYGNNNPEVDTLAAELTACLAGALNGQPNGRGEAFPFEWPSVGSYFGIMDSCGFEKAGYFAVQACYSTVPVLHLEPHWNFKKGQTVFVRAFSNCEQVELLLNGQSLGKRANNPCTPLFWQVEFCPGTLLARGYNAGRCVITASRQTAQKAAKIVLTPVNPTLTNSGEEVAIVNAHLADANGNPCPTENKKINFEAVGDGKILGVGNGNQNSHERDAASSRRLFNGRCQVKLKAAPGAKALALKAKCQGVLPATVTFNILKTAQPEYVPETYSRLLGGFVESNICFTQKPDPLMTIADREMNLFVPLVLNPTRFQPFNGSYKLYRTRLLFANDGQNRRCTLHFDELRCGAAEMYANGALVFSGGRILEQPVEVTFETGGLESMEFRILITASGVADCDGIRGFVTVAVE